MLSYKPEFQPARALLLQPYNSLDVYVEDDSCQNVYVKLLSRILEGTAYRVTSVYPLSGRKNVIDKALELEQDASRKRLFIIDGDFDLLLDRPAPAIKNLHRLNVYCLENLLISEQALVQIAMECQPSLGLTAVVRALDVNQQMSKWLELLVPLFISYAVSEGVHTGLRTVAYPVQQLLEVQRDPQSLSFRLVLRRLLELNREVRKRFGLAEYRRVRDVCVRVLKMAQDVDGFVSGKDYLLPLIHLHLVQTVRFQEHVSRLKVRLASVCPLDRDPILRESVLQAVI